MTDRHTGSRSDLLLTVFWLTFLAAIVPNTINSFAEIQAQWWTALRIVLSAIFTCALVALVLDRLDRSRKRGHADRSVEGQ